MRNSTSSLGALRRTSGAFRHCWLSFIAFLVTVAISSPSEASVIFDFSSNPGDFGLTLGTGFGQDGAEPGTLVDLQFTVNPSIVGTHFTLNNPGDSQVFEFGTLAFSEADIDPDEFDNLNLAAKLGFTNPALGIANIVGSAAPVLGTVGDPGLDLRVFFTPVNLNFGIGGQYTVSLGAYQFTQAGSQSIFATVTLNTAATPEPGSLTLLAAAGALAVARVRRKRALKNRRSEESEGLTV